MAAVIVPIALFVLVAGAAVLWAAGWLLYWWFRIVITSLIGIVRSSIVIVRCVVILTRRRLAKRSARRAAARAERDRRATAARARADEIARARAAEQAVRSEYTGHPPTDGHAVVEIPPRPVNPPAVPARCVVSANPVSYAVARRDGAQQSYALRAGANTVTAGPEAALGR